ncbi:hypothetical protein A6302_01710 [Methylobrevis pamukkalensis]|uniref:DUF2339 domain-containing protein n=1 Tax=Methylobrevis pamukkalensis TaxID=1439726 RepID=A0A1E3H3P4_9HYPH|nr:hypothetical protein A6302_01710 [Methylobrevis pamukkalensis]
MDSLAALLVLVMLAILGGSLLGIAAFVKSRGLAREVTALRDRIAVLEARASGLPRADTADDPVDEAARQADAAGFETAKGKAPTTAPPASGLPAPDASEPDAPTPDVPPQAALAERPRAPRDLEEAIGSRWAVWVGGIALALGGVFLVRYSIEAGLLGPRRGSPAACCWPQPCLAPASGCAAVRCRPRAAAPIFPAC